MAHVIADQKAAILDDAELVALVEMAIANPCRTAYQQSVLVELCEAMNPQAVPFVDWKAQAESTWAALPCVVCDAWVPLGAKSVRCDVCASEAVACQ